MFLCRNISDFSGLQVQKTMEERLHRQENTRRSTQNRSPLMDEQHFQHQNLLLRFPRTIRWFSNLPVPGQSHRDAGAYPRAFNEPSEVLFPPAAHVFTADRRFIHRSSAESWRGFGFPNRLCPIFIEWEVLQGSIGATDRLRWTLTENLTDSKVEIFCLFCSGESQKTGRAVTEVLPRPPTEAPGS